MSKKIIYGALRKQVSFTPQKIEAKVKIIIRKQQKKHKTKYKYKDRKAKREIRKGKKERK